MYEFLDRRYALALYEACNEKGNVELVLQQFKEIINEMDSNNGFIKIINNPQISKINKKRIFRELFENCIEKELMNFILLTIDKERILYLREKYEQYRLLYLQYTNIITAEIASVIPLTSKERERFKVMLERKYKKTIMLKQKIDKTLIGGVIISIGDEMIDGSIKSGLVYFKKKFEANADIDNINDMQINEFKHKEQYEVLKANITTVIPLTDNERVKLIANLEKFYERKIELIESIDQDILGGIIVTIGNDVTEYTIKDKLNHVQNLG